jgi:hypothetical protein
LKRKDASKTQPAQAVATKVRVDYEAMTITNTWGTSPEERRRSYPCDRLINQPEDSLYRGVTINASPKTVFRWLCQMRVAPYSYDWIDNCGHQSPPELTPGLEDLALGQGVMEIFELVDFARDQHITLRIKPNSKALRLFGDIAGSYCVVASDTGSCRLLVKLECGTRQERGVR